MCRELAFDAKRTAGVDRAAYVANAHPGFAIGDVAHAALEAAWSQPLPAEIAV